MQTLLNSVLDMCINDLMSLIRLQLGMHNCQCSADIVIQIVLHHYFPDDHHEDDLTRLLNGMHFSESVSISDCSAGCSVQAGTIFQLVQLNARL